MKKGLGIAYDKWNISVVICDTDIPSGQPSHGGDRKTFEVMTSNYPRGTLGSVAFLLAATLYQWNPDRNHKPWNIVSTERYILHMQVLLECRYIWIERSQWGNWNHLFCRNVRSKPPLTVNFEVEIKVLTRPICICGVLFFKLNRIDVINEITKPRII